MTIAVITFQVQRMNRFERLRIQRDRVQCHLSLNFETNEAEKQLKWNRRQMGEVEDSVQFTTMTSRGLEKRLISVFQLKSLTNRSHEMKLFHILVTLAWPSLLAFCSMKNRNYDGLKGPGAVTVTLELGS